MPDREAYYLSPAREAFERASAEDQRAYDRIVSNLCDDPWIDPPLKSRLVLAPVVVSLYNDTRYWVIYHLPSNTLEVWMIGKEPDKPRLNPDP